MKRIFKAQSALFFATIFLSQVIFASDHKAFFWQLKEGNATIYLFGSIHLADPSFYPLREEIEAAFSESTVLAVEADTLNQDPMQAQKLMFQYGMYPVGEKLTDHISEQTFMDLKKSLVDNKLPLPLSLVVRQRPGLLMVTLGYMMAMQSGLEMAYGLDLHFLRQAVDSGKEIFELEGSEHLMKIMASLEPAEYIVRETLKQLEQGNDLLGPMVTAWKNGDEAVMENLAINEQMDVSPESQYLMDVFLFERNRNMAEKIKGFIQQGGTYFVVVGAAHLVGDKGIPTLLKHSGFKVLRR